MNERTACSSADSGRWSRRAAKSSAARSRSRNVHTVRRLATDPCALRVRLWSAAGALAAFSAAAAAAAALFAISSASMASPNSASSASAADDEAQLGPFGEEVGEFAAAQAQN